MTENGEHFVVSRDEFNQMLKETEEKFQELAKVINIHAEVIGCHRYILNRFVPPPQLEAAAREYRDQRVKEINESRGDAVAPGVN